MLFLIPYRPALEIDRIPFVTLLVCVLCGLVYWHQGESNKEIVSAAKLFCDDYRSTAFRRTLLSVRGSETPADCTELILAINDPLFGKHALREALESSKKLPLYGPAESKAVVAREINKALRKFQRLVAPDLTSKLAYRAGSWDITRMWSSMVAHASLDHIIGNLVAFLAFGMFVEAILGTVLFTGVLLALGITTATAFSLWHLTAVSPHAVIGLSGVVYGMMGLLAYFWPSAKVRCLLWVVIIFKRISVPVWILALGYIGWDLYELLQGDSLGVSLISHVAGGLSGFALGWLFFGWRKRELAAVIANQPPYKYG